MQDYLISNLISSSLDTGDLTPRNLFEKSEKKFAHSPSSDTLIICLPGWGQSLWSWVKVKKFILKTKRSCLFYEFPRAIFSNNHQLTKDCFSTINKTVRADIKKLKEKHSFKNCVLVSISLASSFGSMIYKNNPDVTEIIHIAPGENLARDMWHGCRTQHLRRSYERQGISLNNLEKRWHDLAPEYNFPDSKTRVKIFFCSSDRVIPYKLGRSLDDTLKKNGFKTEVTTFSYGHYFLIWRLLLNPPNFLIFLTLFLVKPSRSDLEDVRQMSLYMATILTQKPSRSDLDDLIHQYYAIA